MSARHRSALIVTVLAAVGCTSSAPPASPLPQRSPTASDTVTRLAVTRALGAFAAPRGPRIIVTSPDDHLTPHGLPDSDDLTFLILPRAEIQRFADDSGDFSYLEIYPVVFVGDTASVAITLASALQRRDRQGPVVRRGASSCEWILVKRRTRWVFGSPRNCFTLG